VAISRGEIPENARPLLKQMGVSCLADVILWMLPAAGDRMLLASAAATAALKARDGQQFCSVFSSLHHCNRNLSTKKAAPKAAP
jgi:hypothetical protein